MRDGDIWLVRADAGSPIRLTHEGLDSEPQWSPDGTRLLFVRGSAAAAELYTVGADGAGLRRLTNDGLEQASPRWASRGGLIAYVQPHDSNGNGLADPAENAEVWLMREDGSGLRKVADGFDPAWSPDGLRLAYATNGRRQTASPSGPSENSLHLVNAQGQNDWELLPLKAVPQDLEQDYQFPFRPGTLRVRAPSWAADGHHIAASADGHTGLALSLDDQGGRIKLWVLNYEGGVGRATFAPVGGRLAVESRPASGFSHVLLIDTVSGQKAADLGSERLNYSALEPAWAADSRRVAVVTFSGAPGAPSGARELLVFGSDGVLQTRAAAGNLGQPAWNPAR